MTNRQAPRPYRGPAARDLARLGLTRGTELWLRVQGDSMLPLLRPGDRVALQSTEPEDLRRGDLVVLVVGDSLVTHRLIGRRAEGFVAKGDNRARSDPPVPTSHILGRVGRIDRDGRILSLDRPAWRLLNRLIAWSSRLSPRPGSADRPGPRRLAGLLRRGNAALVHAALARSAGGPDPARPPGRSGAEADVE